MKAAIRAGIRILMFAAAGAALWGCLLQQPLVRPEDAYDARAALRGDSLERFDSVEVWLEDAEDSRLVVLLWKGPLASPESLGVGAADGSRNLVYVVRGYRRDRGNCFVERKSRGGETMGVVTDTCVAKDTTKPPPPPPDTLHPPPPYVRPHFQGRDLDVVDSIPGSMRVSDMPAFRITARTSEDWIQAAWESSGGDSAAPGRDSVLRVVCRTWSLPVGHDTAYVVLDSAGSPLDSLRVLLTIGPRFLRGKVVDWGEGAPQIAIRVELATQPMDFGKGYTGFTGEDGSYAIAVNEALPAAYYARFSGVDRIGKLDTLRLVSGPVSRFVTAIPPVGSFRTIDLGDKREIRSVAVAAGYAVVMSTPFNQAGKAYLVRMDTRPPVLEKTIDLANNDGDSLTAEYFDAGEMLADSDALYISYPDANRIGRIAAWRTSPVQSVVPVTLQPGGLLRDGAHLLTLGRLSDGTLALARFLAADLSLLEIDTLKGYGWDGAQPESRSPKLVSGPGGYYAVEGNAPNVRGHVLLIGKADGKVKAARDLSEGEVDDLAWVGGLLYVGGSSPGSRWLRGFHADLSPADSIDAATPIDRLAADASGLFGGYAFATSAENDSLLVFAPFSRETLGRLPVPGARPGRSIALDPASRTVLVSDGDALRFSSF
ncbi:MAG: hypothetical protein JF616_06330 [Fibrobacteres bacterium]|nr:hypothetical protein [Fibrobacterota bacterium]